MGNISKHIKRNGLLVENPQEGEMVAKIRSNYGLLSKLSDDKIALAERGVRMLDKYVQKLQGEFDRLKEMGHNIGDADTAPAGVSGLSGLGSPGMGGFPQLDMSSMQSNKKRKLPQVNTQLHGGQVYGNSPSSAQMQNYQNNPYAQQMQMNGNMQYNMPSSSAYGQYGNQQFTPQQQQQLAQQMQAYTNSGQLPNGVSSTVGGSSNASRPHRPSRLSSSFSANGMGANTQILPSSTAAHLQPGSSTPTGAHMLSAGGANAGLKRARPNGSAAGAGPKNKKKKRIQLSDDDSVQDEAQSVEDVDAEGEEDDAEGDEDRSMMSTSSMPRRPGQHKNSSRASTPTVAQMLANNGMRANAKGAGNKQGRSQLQPLAPYPTSRPGEEDAEGEDEDADAEGEEDLGVEYDETNAEDPTLYCFCQRVSYGNVRPILLPSGIKLTSIVQMIACDNPDCRYEWFHWACVKVNKQPADNEKWYCPECRSKNAQDAGTPRAIISSGGGSSYAQLQAQQQLLLQGQAGQAGRSNRRG